MATYLQGVTDYIPDYQPFQPDFNFYANVLQTKQNQYDSNYNELNNIYSDIINAPLTHNLNKEKKDVLLKDIDTNLKKVSGLDLSLEQNVSQATQVFRPFYEDQYLMKDMAFTKNAYNVLSRANSLKNSTDENTYEQWWPTGIKAINYEIQDFADASLDETLGMSNVSYTPYMNSVKHYMDMATKLGVKAQTKYNVNRRGQKDPYGDITITQKNGQLILPTLNEMFVAEYTKNPRLQDVYRIQSYVERKDYINQHLSEYGDDKNATEKAYLQKQYDWLTTKVNKDNQVAAENLKVTKSKTDDVEKKASAGKGNPKQKAYLDALAQGATVQEAILMSTRKLNAKINDGNRTEVTEGQKGGLNLENIKLARMKVDAGMASMNAQKDIRLAAKNYSDIDALYEQDLSQVGLARFKSGLRKKESEYEAGLKAKAKAHQAYIDWGIKINKFQYKAIDSNNPMAGGVLVNNDDYDKTFQRTSTDPGSTTEKPIDVASLNAEMAKNAQGEYQDPFLDGVMTSLYDLVSTNQISDKELNKILTNNVMSGQAGARELAYASGRKINPNSDAGRKISKMSAEEYYRSTGEYESVTRDASGNVIGIDAEGNEMYLNPDIPSMASEADFIDLENFRSSTGMKDIGMDDLYSPETTDAEDAKAADKFMSMYNTWKTNKTKGRDLIRNTFVYDGWNDWLKTNSGSDMTAQWYSENPKLKESLFKYEEFHQFEHANEKIYATNSKRITDGLELALAKKYSDVFDAEDINKIAEFYKTQYFDGTLDTRALEDGEVVMRDGREVDGVRDVITIDGKQYAGTDIDAFLRKEVLPDVLRKNQAQAKESVSKLNKGTDWNETKGLSDVQWKELNTYIDNDATMQSLEKEYGLESEPNLINTSNYWDIPRASGFDEVSDHRDDLAKQWRRNNNAVSEMDEKDMQSLNNSIADILDEAYTGIVMDPNSETGLMTMINGIKAGQFGKASLASNFEDRYVNMQDPQSQGFRDFASMIEDVNRINFNQSGNYRVSVNGLKKIDSEENGTFKHDLNPQIAARLVETLFQENIRSGEKGETIKLSNSRIAMEDRNTNAITIYPSRKFLEENIKSVPYQNYEGESDDKASILKAIDGIMANGLTFIAPKNEWSNSFLTTNKESPLEMALNALGEVAYEDPYNSGTYQIRKIDGVPGVTHQGNFTLKGLNPDGSFKEISKPMSYGTNRGGSTLETIQQHYYNTIMQASMQNLAIYRQILEKGDQEAIQKAEAAFNFTPYNAGFNYGND
tara:strand:+ start:361 stop:4137 length:3777 start_codon:yes stop_codon:yes gene_type:complete